MANEATKIKNGPYVATAKTVTMIANGEIPMYGAVILIAAGSGEEEPRVGTTTTAGSRLAYGIVVGPQLNSGKAADAAGDRVQVHPFGDGLPEKFIAEGTVAAFDPLETSATAGALQTQTAVAHAATYGNGTTSDTQEKKSAAACAVSAKARSDGETGVCLMTRGIVK